MSPRQFETTKLDQFKPNSKRFRRHMPPTRKSERPNCQWRNPQISPYCLTTTEIANIRGMRTGSTYVSMAMCSRLQSNLRYGFIFRRTGTRKTIWLFIQFHLNPRHFANRYPGFAGGSWTRARIYTRAHQSARLRKYAGKNAQNAKFQSLVLFEKSRDSPFVWAMVLQLYACACVYFSHYQNLIS